MNRRLILTIILTAIASFSNAKDKTSHLYEGEVAGVICSACSARVKGALSKLSGVTEVKITLGKPGNLPKIEITSTSTDITTEAANKALGEDGKMYQIRNLKLQQK